MEHGKKNDIVITTIFIISTTIVMLYNKSLPHAHLGYLLILLYLGFGYFCAIRKNNKLLIIVMTLSFLIAIMTDYLNLTI